MNIDSRVLSFVVLNQLNLKSAGEPFATLLKTCHRKVGFFKLIFSISQNNKNSVLARAAAFLFVERIAIYCFSENDKFSATEFHKWYWTLCADRYYEEWGRAENIAKRFMQIIFQVRDQFGQIPVIVYPESDGLRKIAYQISERFLLLAGNNYSLGEVQDLSGKLERFSIQFLRCLFDKRIYPELEQEILKGCNDRLRESEEVLRILPLSLHHQKLSSEENRLEEGDDGVQKKEDMDLPFLRFHLVMLAKKKPEIFFGSYLCWSPNPEDYDYKFCDDEYGKDLAFVSILLSTCLVFEEYQKLVDDLSVDIFKTQSKVLPNKTLSLNDLHAIIREYFEDIVFVLFYYLPLFMSSKKGEELAKEIRANENSRRVNKDNCIFPMLEKISKLRREERSKLYREIIDLQVRKVFRKLDPQANGNVVDVYTDYLREAFFDFANIVSRAYMRAYEEVYFKDEPEIKNLVEKVNNNTTRYEETIRLSLDMPLS